MDVNVSIERYSGWCEDGGRIISNEVDIEVDGIRQQFHYEFVKDEHLRLLVLEQVLKMLDIQVNIVETNYSESIA